MKNGSFDFYQNSPGSYGGLIKGSRAIASMAKPDHFTPSMLAILYLQKNCTPQTNTAYNT